MDILSFTFTVIAVLVLGSAWLRLRSNWRSVQSMRASNKETVVDASFDPPEGLDVAEHLGHGHDGGHHSGDSAVHHSGDFHGGDHGGFDGGGGHH